jgi:hypothetical protein
VNLAPLGIESLYQRQGMAKLVPGRPPDRPGKDCLSFVVGYDTYYTRFGYKVAAFGLSSLTLDRDQVLPSDTVLESRGPPKPIIAVCAGAGRRIPCRFRAGARRVMVDWISPNPNVRSAVYLRGGTLVNRPHSERRAG